MARDDRIYNALMYVAIAMTVAWVGWTLYDSFFADIQPGEQAYLAGERAFEDGQFEKSEQEYRRATWEAPGEPYTWRGLGRALLEQGDFQGALRAFDEAVALAPGFAGTYANRGILHDRAGRYREALADYEKALALDPEIAEGPGWLTRFFRLQSEAPPTIADRARYLKAELAEPVSERVLHVPELDAAQRPYKR